MLYDHYNPICSFSGESVCFWPERKPLLSAITQSFIGAALTSATSSQIEPDCTYQTLVKGIRDCESYLTPGQL